MPVPPTEEKVRQFLAYVHLEPDQVIGEIPERDRAITAEKVASLSLILKLLLRNLFL
jgi:hypothetical protein